MTAEPGRRGCRSMRPPARARPPRPPRRSAGPPRRWPEGRPQTAHRIAVQDDGHRHGHPRRRAQLLSLPRTVGVDPASGEEITAQNGRYGPYLKKGTDSRSLAGEDQLFTVTLDDALKLYAEPSDVADRPPHRRCVSWATTRSARSRWSSRMAASVRTSPTARPTPVCAKGDEVATITPSGRWNSRRSSRLRPGEEGRQEDSHQEDHRGLRRPQRPRRRQQPRRPQRPR